MSAGVPYGDIAQLVEHLLCKQGVTGSNPVVSIFCRPALGGRTREAGARQKIPRIVLYSQRPVWIVYLYRGEVTRSWHVAPSQEEWPAPLIVSDGDFVLCQGESGSGASLDACDGSGALFRGNPAVPFDV